MISFHLNAIETGYKKKVHLNARSPSRMIKFSFLLHFPTQFKTRNDEMTQKKQHDF